MTSLSLLESRFKTRDSDLIDHRCWFMSIYPYIFLWPNWRFPNKSPPVFSSLSVLSINHLFLLSSVLSLSFPSYFVVLFSVVFVVLPILVNSWARRRPPWHSIHVFMWSSEQFATRHADKQVLSLEDLRRAGGGREARDLNEQLPHTYKSTYGLFRRRWQEIHG